MTRVSKGINSTYPAENMLKAVAAVNGGLSIRQAATKYGVPRSSLGDRMSGRTAPAARPGKAPVIPKEIESQMVTKAMTLAEQGFGVSKRNLSSRAGQLCRTMGLKNNFTKGVPGKAWWAGLRARHPSLSLRKPEKLATVRSKGVNSTVVGAYFVDLHGLVNGLPPTHIWNMDESGISMEHSPSVVIARKGSKVVPGRTANSRESVTFLPCVNAAGQKMPPLIIVKGKTSRSLRAFNTHEGPDGALWAFQKNAWMNDQMGSTWFEEVFMKHCGDGRPQLLIMDNHRSHETLGLLEAAAANNIGVFTFPPHSTHYLCPLDRTVFGPLKREYDSVCSEFMSSKTTAIVNKLTFPGLLNRAYLKAFSRTNIVAGFEATGIYEWNPLKVPIEAFSPSAPFDRKERDETDEHPLQWAVAKVSNTSGVSDMDTETVVDNGIADVNIGGFVFAPEVLDQDGNVIGQLNDTAGTNDPMFSSPTADTTDEDTADLLVALDVSDLDRSTGSSAASGNWSEMWNHELDSMFDVKDTTNVIDKENSGAARSTSHRLLTSDDILKEKRHEQNEKDRKAKDKEERQRKREANRKIKEDKIANKRVAGGKQ
ncbi:MAG: helix-turn-helix domain-containing protein [Sedimenticola sp.]